MPPYASSGITTWLSAGRRRSTASSAAIPLAKAKPDAAPSRLARQRSRAVRVGLAVREYS